MFSSSTLSYSAALCSYFCLHSCQIIFTIIDSLNHNEFGQITFRELFRETIRWVSLFLFTFDIAFLLD